MFNVNLIRVDEGRNGCSIFAIEMKTRVVVGRGKDEPG